MTSSEFEHILKEVKPYTDYIYLHVKGEPLLHPELDTILSIAQRYLMKVNITTNGTLFPKVIDTIKKYNCIHQINFSLHSENNIPAYCEQIFKAVDDLSEKVLIIYRFWALKGNQLNKKPTDIVEKMKNHYHLSTETVERIKKETHVKINSHIFVDKQEKFDWPSLDLKEESDGFCYGLKNQIAILVDGTVVPCCLDGEGIINLGNVLETPLDDILNDNKALELSKGFRERKCTEKLCRHCSYKNRFKNR